MHVLKRLRAAALAAVALFAATTASASAAGVDHALFVQTDNLKGNQVVVYDRTSEGTLVPAGTYNTGGLGGQLAGSVVDHLASQGSLAYDRQDGLLYAVNAASNTISVFAVFGDRLALRQVLASGGTFPVSIAVSNGLVYVLNAEEGGSVQGFRARDGRLAPIPASNRALGLNPTATPQFTNTPGQVAFSPGGSQLLVTTKANGEDIDVFSVGPLGLLSGSPVVDSLPGTVPFAVAFDQHGNLLVAEAGTNALASFELREDGEVGQLDQVDTEQAATCWVVTDGARFYTSNAGSASLSAFQSSKGGQLLTLFATAPTDAGTVDAAVPSGGRFLYVQTGGAGIVDEFSIGVGGALGPIGSVSVPGAAGGEGIVAP